jgi:hypothetical protein
MTNDNLANLAFTPEQKAFYSDIVQVVRKHHTKVTATEMMALLSQEIGMMKAMHDSRNYDKQTTLDCINKNQELGERTFYMMNCEAKGSA